MKLRDLPVRRVVNGKDAGTAQHQVDSIAALDEIAFALYTGGQPQPDNGKWLAKAIWSVFAGEFSSFDEAFGFSPGQGDKHKTAAARFHQSVRDRAVSRLLKGIPGTPHAQAVVLQRIMKIYESTGSAPDDQSARALAALAADNIKLPGSVEGLRQIVLAVAQVKPGY